MEIPMKNREFCYLQHPSVYDIPPCDCGSHHYTWSEYEEYLWCFTCEVDFKPKNYGIFDGPIPYHLSKLLGIHFYKVELKSGEYFSPNLNFSYHKVLNFDKYQELNLDLIFDFDLLHRNHENKEGSFKVTLNYDNTGLSLSSKEKLEDGLYVSRITTYSKKLGFQDWELSFESTNNTLALVDDGSFQILLMKNYLNLTLPTKEPGLINKI